MAALFQGGIRLAPGRDPGEKPGAVPMEIPDELVIALPEGARPCVSVGERVLRGQCIADSALAQVTPVHASAAGTVAAVARWAHPSGGERTCVAIECDHDGGTADFAGVPDWENADPAVLLAAVRAAGITGQARLRTDGRPDTLIVDCTELTPMETARTALVDDDPQALADGVRVLCRIFPGVPAALGIEWDREETIRALHGALADLPQVRIERLSTKYPQGDEAVLIGCITGREPEKTVCPVLDAFEVIAMGKAVRDGTPMTECVLTAAGGAVKTRRELRVPVGASLRAIAAACGGFVGEPAQIVVGDCMQGVSQPSLNVPVDKGTRAVLFLSEAQTAREESVCVRCGRCAAACPAGLTPAWLYEFARQGMDAQCRSLRVHRCTGCGACSAACPAGLPLSAQILSAKEAAGEPDDADGGVRGLWERARRLLPWINRNDTP